MAFPWTILLVAAALALVAWLILLLGLRNGLLGSKDPSSAVGWMVAGLAAISLLSLTSTLELMSTLDLALPFIQAQGKQVWCLTSFELDVCKMHFLYILNWALYVYHMTF